MNHFPFIIWTFRRSGGTNLGQALFENSSYKSVQHEPFNTDRKFKHVINDWKKNKDKEELYTSVEKILKDKILIKHCLEIIPSEINDAIVSVSKKFGYKHLFLYRENAKSRLLSLNYSLKTDVWGREHLLTRPFDAEGVFASDIQIEKLLKHEAHCRNEMRRIYDSIESQGSLPLSVSFEQLYKSEHNYASMLVRQMFCELNGSSDYVTDDFLEKTLKGGGQGTNKDYMNFPNSEEFVREISKLSEYKLNDVKSDFDISLDCEHIIVEYYEIWKRLPSVVSTKAILQGVILSDVDYKLFNDSKEIKVIRGIRSERISEKFTNNPNAISCRFLSEPLNYDDIPSVISIRPL